MVFDHEKDGYENLVNGLHDKDLAEFENESVQFEDVSDLVEAQRSNSSGTSETLRV
jgi:hypothetical protein